MLWILLSLLCTGQQNDGLVILFASYCIAHFGVLENFFKNTDVVRAVVNTVCRQQKGLYAACAASLNSQISQRGFRGCQDCLIQPVTVLRP